MNFKYVHVIKIFEKVSQAFKLDNLSLVHILILKILHDLKLTHRVLNIFLGFQDRLFDLRLLKTLVLRFDDPIIKVEDLHD